MSELVPPVHDLSHSPNRPVRAAIEQQANRNEIYLCWGGLAEAGLGVLITAVIWWASLHHWGLTASTGPQYTAVFTLLGTWYGLALVLLKRGVGTGLLPWLTPVLEASFPVILMGVEARIAGARFAAFGSTGPVLFSVAFSLAILRLRWQVPLLVGALGAIEYAVLLGWIVFPGLSPEDGSFTYGSPVYLYTRPVVVALVGITSALITLRLRASVVAVHQQVRSEELFGKYRLGERVAAGGMGEVFRATYCSEGGFERPVAIKRIHAHLASDANLVEAFRREAQLSSKLTHPNIVQVLDFGTEGGGYFLAMEYIEGVSLQGLLRATQQWGVLLPAALVAWIGKQVAHGLAFAHGEARDTSGQPLRIIHRDLSPANLLLSRAGEVKLTDFGVAKALGDKEGTVTASVAGKISYMAPEQVQALLLDPRGDLFSLGIVLWEALCGQRLFRSVNEAATIRNVLNKEIPAPSQLRGDLRSPLWDEVILQALARDRDRRFPSAAAMGTALEAVLAGEDTTGPDELGAWVARAMNSVSPESTLPSESHPLSLPAGSERTATVRARR